MPLYTCRGRAEGGDWNRDRDRDRDRDENNDDFQENLFEELRENKGRFVTVFTQSGGCSGRGFTGLLVEVNRRFIRLVTSFPCAPRHPFGRNIDSRSDCCSGRLGTAIIIPLNKIVSFVFN